MFATPAGRNTSALSADTSNYRVRLSESRTRRSGSTKLQASFTGFARSSSKLVTAAKSTIAQSAAIVALSLGVCAWAQDAPRPEAVAVRLTTLPTLDGDVVNDPAWQSLIPITDFTQWQPTNGAPATRKTEVYFGFSDEFVHIGVICHESSQDDIVVSSDGFHSDSFAMAIDTYLVGQSGFMFGTNPIGAEFEIPFTSLRYGDAEVQTWGVNFARINRKINEQSHWAPLPIQFSTYRLSLAGRISGIEVPAYRRDLKFAPYALGGIVTSNQSQTSTTQRESEFGFDLKYAITQSVILDATYNPDFAQVESDRLQINLGRFSLFFPETRPFFLENASMFQVGSGNIQLFHSRNIGIEPNGRKLPITGGARITGKLGAMNNVGVLLVRAESGSLLPQNDYVVGRFNRELRNRSSIGVLVANREGGGTENRTFGMDGKWGIGEHIDLRGYAAKTSTQDIATDDHAYSVGANFRSEVWNLNLDVAEVGEGFNPEIGFTSRVGYRSLATGIRHTTSYPEKGGLKEWNQITFLDGIWDFEGYLESSSVYFETWWLWENGADVWPAVNFISEGVKQEFEIAGVAIPSGDYDTVEYSINAATPSTWPLRTGIRLSQGGFYNGDRFSADLFFNYRVEDKWDMFAAYIHNDIDLPTKDSAFSVDLARLGITYTFSAKAQLSALVQHNVAADIFATNVRFSWLRTASTGFYVVYSEFDERQGVGTNRKELVLKYTHLFDVL